MKRADLSHSGNFLDHPTLAESPLPRLVREQQRLDARIGPRERELEPLIAKEKALRGQIDALLMQAGLGHLDAVTVNGLVVTHNKRRGQTKIDEAILVVGLTMAGVPEETVRKVLKAASTTSADVHFATVAPAKVALKKAA
jgi:hypothetical protein